MQQRIVRNRRWRSPTSDSTLPDHDILAVIDDRWSVLIVAVLMLGASRYDQVTSMLQISSAVLAKRLQRLCALEILINCQGPADARPSFYQLDKSGQDLFAYIMTLMQWGGQNQTRPDMIGWIHTHCGQRVTGRTVCSHCGEPLLPHQIGRSPAPSGSPR